MVIRAVVQVKEYGYDGVRMRADRPTRRSPPIGG
jgi:hypothetical protein